MKRRLFFFLKQPEVDERMQRLENDKDSLQMQVSILMDQIDAQTEKISDLERGLSERSYQLQRSEETLQKVFIIIIVFAHHPRDFYFKKTNN